MKQVLIFSGTIEGRRLSEILAKKNIECVVCVATEYGEAVMQPCDGVTILKGRKNQEEMCALMRENEFAAVVDATHPYAVEVSANIRESAKEESLPYLRLKRQTKWDMSTEPNVVYCESQEQCVDRLISTNGNILLTTGSKELSLYCTEENLRKRLYVRVLPGIESLQLCEKNGITGKQIIAMQGPFTENLNRAILEQLQIKHLVTKESGKNGGFIEKIDAAKAANVNVFVVGNPEKHTGYSFAEVVEKLEKILKLSLNYNSLVDISLIGIGMGTKQTMTNEATSALEQADVIFGAKRVIDEHAKGKKSYAYYEAKDIIPQIELLQKECMDECLRIAILFSGDSGFYSGCEKMYQGLNVWREQNEDTPVSIHVYPGISSIAYLAASVGVNWQDAKLMSIHGKGTIDNWRNDVLNAVRYHEKTFILMSGVENVRELGQLLIDSQLLDCTVAVGYQLSYQEQSVKWCSPKQCIAYENEGLYVCLVRNPKVENRLLSPGLEDGAFIRDKVPMTKEEIRELIICKLRLHENAVVYDIGSGTGSVSVDIARMSGTIKVYAIEQKEEAVTLTRKNVEALGAYNVDVIAGKAPQALEGVPAATHAFIGGSSGNLKEIIKTLYRINADMRVVITAVSLETIAEINEVLQMVPTSFQEMIQVQVSRARCVGTHHLMQAENPIYMATLQFTD